MSNLGSDYSFSPWHDWLKMIVPFQYEVGLLETPKRKWKGIRWLQDMLMCEVKWDVSHALHKSNMGWPRGIVLICYDELKVLIMIVDYDQEWQKICT